MKSTTRKIYLSLLSAIFLIPLTVAHAAGTYTYTYDDFYRVTKVEHSDGTVTNYTYDNLGNRTSVSVAPATSGNTCPTPPVNGDLTIDSDCAINDTTAINGNLYVQNNSVLTIEQGARLSIDLSVHKIVVQQGSGILIKSGGAIN